MKSITAWSLLVVATLGSVLCSGHSLAQPDFDRESHHRAVQYCSGDVSRPMALSPDGQVLCFDGPVPGDLDMTPARGLKENGLFVVRSHGGDSGAALVLAKILGSKHATVVVHELCFSACAMFFLVASDQAYVLKGTLVAWHHMQERASGPSLCAFVIEPHDGKPKKVQRGRCQTGGEDGVNLWPEMEQFFNDRAANPFLPPPDSLFVRRVIRNLYAETGVFPNIAWTIHPRYYPTLFKTKIFYDAYPESQEEVDVMVARTRIGRVIYDP